MATTRERVWAGAHKAAALIAEFGLALSPEKVEGPAQVLEFLGIVFDSLAETLSISQERKKELLGLLTDFDGKGWASRAAVQSLLGKLSFAATVLPGARPFLRRVIDTMRAGHKRIALGAIFRADIAYWAAHIDGWKFNGRAKWRVDAADPFVFGSDASTTGFTYGLEACPARALASLPERLQPGSVRMGCWSASAGHAVKGLRSSGGSSLRRWLQRWSTASSSRAPTSSSSSTTSPTCTCSTASAHVSHACVRCCGRSATPRCASTSPSRRCTDRARTTT